MHVVVASNVHVASVGGVASAWAVAASSASEQILAAEAAASGASVDIQEVALGPARRRQAVAQSGRSYSKHVMFHLSPSAEASKKLMSTLWAQVLKTFQHKHIEEMLEVRVPVLEMEMVKLLEAALVWVTGFCRAHLPPLGGY